MVSARCSCLMVSVLYWTSHSAAQVQVLTWGIVSCSRTRHFTLTVRLSPELLLSIHCKWAMAICRGHLTMQYCGVTCTVMN